jgi:outer membrane protein TolC
VIRTLDECLSIALERHPRIGAADSGVDAGRARIGQARSGYLPQLSGDWSTNRQKSSFSSRTGGPSDTAGGAVAQSNAFDFHQGSVSLSQTLFDVGQTFAAIRAAQARTDSLEADADARASRSCSR